MPKPVPMPQSFLDAATMYANSSASINDLGKKFSVSKTTIKKWLALSGTSEKLKNSVISGKLVGRVGNRLGVTVSEKTRKKMSDSRKGKPRTTGFKFSEESKEKMRVAAKHRMATTDSYKKMRDGLEKTRMSLEEKTARNKSRDACKGCFAEFWRWQELKKMAGGLSYCLGIQSSNSAHTLKLNL